MRQRTGGPQGQQDGRHGVGARHTPRSRTGATKGGCGCSDRYAFPDATCKDGDAVYSGCMATPCDGDTAGGPLFPSWCAVKTPCGGAQGDDKNWDYCSPTANTMSTGVAVDGYVSQGEGYWATGYTQHNSTLGVGVCASVCTGLPGCAAFFRTKASGNCYTYTETPASSEWTPGAEYEAFLSGTSRAVARKERVMCACDLSRIQHN